MVGANTTDTVLGASMHVRELLSGAVKAIHKRRGHRVAVTLLSIKSLFHRVWLPD